MAVLVPKQSGNTVPENMSKVFPSSTVKTGK